MKELIIWVLALVMLGVATPMEHGHLHHFSLCPLASVGIEWCPGCGLGRSVTQLMHGNFAESWKYHWLGLPALLMIVYRIVELIKLNIKAFKLKYKETRYV